MKNANKTDLTLVVSVIAIAVLLLVMRASAQQYEYKGVYPAQAIFTNLCENCFLELPAEFLQTSPCLVCKYRTKVKTLERLYFVAKVQVGLSRNVATRGVQSPCRMRVHLCLSRALQTNP